MGEAEFLARLTEEADRVVQVHLAGWGSPRLRPLSTDVAILERAAAAVFDGEEALPMDASALRELSPSDWAHVRLLPAGTFRLARVHPGAVDVLDAFLEDRPLPEKTGYGRVVVAFYRKGFVVLRRTLGPFDGCLLAALVAGATLEAVLETAATSFPGGFTSGQVLAGWFAEWAGLGFFAGLQRVSEAVSE